MWVPERPARSIEVSFNTMVAFIIKLNYVWAMSGLGRGFCFILSF